MIRHAVGAIAVHHGQILLVRKVVVSCAVPSPLPISPEWGFPKGGMAPGDRSPEAALMRELLEETGSTEYALCARIPIPFFMPFDSGAYAHTPYEGQETTMFLVEFTGNPDALSPCDNEIDRVGIFSRADAYSLLGDSHAGRYLRHIMGRYPWLSGAVRDSVY